MRKSNSRKLFASNGLHVLEESTEALDGKGVSSKGESPMILQASRGGRCCAWTATAAGNLSFGANCNSFG